MRRLYLDLDGVIFDFDSHYIELFGEKSEGVPDEILWKNIKNHGTFFEELPIFEGALEFIATLEDYYPVTILTACPKSDYRSAAIQKRKAVYANIGTHLTVIPMLGGVNKSLFMHAPGDILIDDFEKNIKSWNDLGGNGIFYRDYETTLSEIRKYYDHTNCDFCDGNGHIWGTPCGGV
jgi:5'(3')-deoxyribonucleotidase